VILKLKEVEIKGKNAMKYIAHAKIRTIGKYVENIYLTKL